MVTALFSVLQRMRQVESTFSMNSLSVRSEHIAAIGPVVSIFLRYTFQGKHHHFESDDYKN